MFNKVSKIPAVLILALLVVGLFTLAVHPALAEITNPAISTQLGSNAADAKQGIPFAIYFITLWRGIISVGGLMVFVFFLWGAIEWISAGGDAGKVGKARDKITQSIIGFILLVSTAVIIAFLGKIFFGDAFDFFNIAVPSSTSQGSGVIGGPGNFGNGGGGGTGGNAIVP